MIFFSNNLCYIKFFSEMYYHVFSTKADQKGGSIHKEKNLSTEIHILVLPGTYTVHNKLSLNEVEILVFLPCSQFGTAQYV